MRWCRRRRRRRLSPLAAAQLQTEDLSQTGIKLTRFVHRPAGVGSRNTALVHSAVRERRSGMECFIQVRVHQAQLDVTREGSALTQTNCTFCRAPPRVLTPTANPCAHSPRSFRRGGTCFCRRSGLRCLVLAEPGGECSGCGGRRRR